MRVASFKVSGPMSAAAVALREVRFTEGLTKPTTPTRSSRGVRGQYRTASRSLQPTPRRGIRFRIKIVGGSACRKEITFLASRRASICVMNSDRCRFLLWCFKATLIDGVYHVELESFSPSKSPGPPALPRKLGSWRRLLESIMSVEVVTRKIRR